jgi:two-component system, chemotaxis family, sensor kinase Cph1
MTSAQTHSGRGFLAACEQEALHLSGAIQAHGTLLIVDADLHPTHAAANIGDWLGGTPQTWLNAPLPASLHTLVSTHPETPGSRSLLPSTYPGSTHALSLCLTRARNGSITLEFTHASGTATTKEVPAPALMIHPYGTWNSMDDKHQARHRLLQHLAQHTGAQRVLYYAFQASGDGEVLDEVLQDETLGSYQGLHFPASDIPLVARQLYLQNPWRLIPDAQQAPIPILGHHPTPPDLSHSDLRSVSPMHQIYLANMGVVGALSFPVVVAGELVALISIHHAAPLNPGVEHLEMLADHVRRFNLSLTAFRAHTRMRLIDNLERHFRVQRDTLLRHGNLASAWPELAPMLLSDFQAEGAILCQDDGVQSHGLCLEIHALNTLDRWFRHHTKEPVWSSDALSLQLPGFPLSEVAGVLALRLLQPRLGHLCIYITRSEYIDEIAWGGNPNKPLEYHDGTLGIAPRRSFEKWVEKRLGHSQPWSNESRLLGLKLRELLQATLEH